jgi:Domain of unknown function (DUF4091)
MTNKLQFLFVVYLMCLTVPTLSLAQTDPLNSAYKPNPNCTASNYPSYVWQTDDMTKVRQDSGSPAGTPCITVYGTQDEWVSFQVHVHATSAINNYSVTVSNLVQSSPSSFTIPCTTTHDCIVFREAYMDVAPTVTGTAATFYNATGYYPDILIPTVDPYYGQTTNAFPFTISAGNNQSAWVDVLIPAAAPAGFYSGTVTVTGNGATIATLPVTIAVWQWPSAGHMPVTATLGYNTATGYNTLCAQQGGSCSSTYPGGAEGEAVDLGAQLVDNRINNAAGGQNFPDTGSFSSFNAQQGPLLSGTAGWHVNTIIPGAQYTQMNLQCGGGCFPNSNNAAIWANWVANFKSSGWLPKLVYGIGDEPIGSAWSSIITNAAAARNFSSPMVPLQVTTDYQAASAAGALNAIDQMVVNVVCMEPFTAPYGGCSTTTVGSQRSVYTTWLSGNCCSGSGPSRTLWGYESCSGSGTCGNGTTGDSNYSYPNYDVDGLPVANRALEWMTYRNQETGELYYLLDNCLTYTCGSGTSDPWTSVYAYGGWGDGTLVYPGTTAHLGSGVTTPIWLPSIRLKMIRDGMQDYEYMNVLTQNGLGTFVTSAIATWVANGYTFNVNPYAAAGSFTGSLETARTSMGNAMHQLTYPGLLPPPSLTGTVQ